MPYVISGGQLERIDKPVTVASTAIHLGDGLAQDYASIWRTQPHVRTVVAFLARNIAQLGLHTYRRVSDTDRERLTEHPVARLLSRPNPWTTPYRWTEALVSDLAIYDNAVLVKTSVSGQPRALVRWDPSQVRPVGDNPFVPDAYELRGSKGKRQVPPEQVVHFRGYNPDDQRWGASPIETLRRILIEEYQAGQYREQLWRNGARISGYLKRPLEAPKWSDTAKLRFAAGWQAQYSGAGSQAGGTPILEDGMSFEPAAVTPEAAQYIEARKLTREEVTAAYHIPPPMVGILEHATYSNITQQHKQMYQDTLGPWLMMLQQDLALQLLGDFSDRADVYLEFNLAEKLRGSFEEQANQLQTSVGAPYMSRNEARARLNLPQVPEGDALVTPLNVLVGGQASPTDSAPPSRASAGAQAKARAPGTYVQRAEQVLSGFFARQGRVVTSQLGAVSKTWGKRAVNDVFDTARWDAELAADVYRLNVAIAAAAAQGTLASVGLDPGDYDEDRALGWLLSNAEGVAAAMNETTSAGLVDALAGDDPLDAVARLFDGYATARAPQAAESLVTSASGFGATEAAQQASPTAVKTWRTRSASPRPSHARIDGQTVAVTDRFSNGALWPGDWALPADERAGCRCDIGIDLT